MTILCLLLFTFISHQSWALESGFISSVPGLSIPNSHTIYEDAQGTAVLRGMEPRSKAQVQELASLGIEHVLIFKTDTKGEVAKEITHLKAAGFSNKAITHIPFPWKDLHDFRQACSMTIQALQVIEKSLQRQHSIFFHCTVGEDRTGYLAGLWGLWSQTYASVDQAFRNEMCERGYEAGNPKKPYRQVVAKIRETLTPTYLKMALLLDEARRRGQYLDESLCEQEPVLNISLKKYQCRG
ncbi:tyrosine-protein phosphatase [Bdellovibrio sp.]|uniref:tyrosine-protein phosphatase n=1 Tax=Bdellovibrio sp. TaxID=28201 RepID=UPI003221DD46